MSIKPLRALLPLLLTSLLVSACSKYQFTVNEKVVYTPAPLFTDFTTADLNLRNCLDQAIKDQAVTAPAQLTLLNCSNAGITSLRGLEIFTGLEHVNLAHNALQRAEALAAMAQLKTLILASNQLRKIPEILGKEHLQEVDLSNNPDLDCADIRQLSARFDGELSAPQQCQ